MTTYQEMWAGISNGRSAAQRVDTGTAGKSQVATHRLDLDPVSPRQTPERTASTRKLVFRWRVRPRVDRRTIGPRQLVPPNPTDRVPAGWICGPTAPSNGRVQAIDRSVLAGLPSASLASIGTSANALQPGQRVPIQSCNVAMLRRIEAAPRDRQRPFHATCGQPPQAKAEPLDR